MFRAQQSGLSPGQNAKHYLAGVLHQATENLLRPAGSKKNSSLFIAMLEKLRHHHRRAKTIVDHSITTSFTKTKQTEAWLKRIPSSA